MAFVRAKRRGGRIYYHLVESTRNGGQVRQRELCYLGQYPTVEAALAGLPQDIERWRRLAATMRANMATWRERLGLPEAAEVPHSRVGSAAVCTMRSKYHACTKYAEAYASKAQTLAERLALLQAWRSAHACPLGG